MICFSKKKIGKEETQKRLSKLVDKWFNNPFIDSITGGKEYEFQKFYERVSGLDYDIGRLPNGKELSRLESEMSNYVNNLKIKTTGPGATFGEYFKLPENILKKNPVTARHFNALVRASNYYHGHQQELKGDLSIMLRSLNKATGDTNLLSKFGFAKSKAQKELSKLQSQYKALRDKGDYTGAEKFWKDNLKDISELNPNLEVMKKMHELLLNPDLVRKQNLSKTKLDYGGDLIQAANLWHVGYPNKGIKPLKERLWKVLGDGLKKSINVFKLYQSEYNDMDFKIKELDRLHDTYFNAKSPDFKRIKNYFPTQVLDIAPTVAKFSQDIHKGFLDKSNLEGRASTETYIRRMVEDVTKALRVSGNVYEKSADRPSRIDQDVVGILDHYTNSTIRFNYNAAVTESLVKALKDLNRASGSDYDQTVRFLSDYIYDMHSSVVGNKFNNSKLANISRTLTSYNFVSKLGLNVRTVARNATQSLQNWVYFGTKGIYTAMKDLQTPAKKEIVDRELSKHGFEFVNIQEISMPKELLNNVKIDASGKVVQDISTMGRKFTDYLQETARITGKPMQWVENNVNRGMTFKIAFLNRYDALMENDMFIRKLLVKQGKVKKGSAATI